MKEFDDLTLLPGLGRSNRDTMIDRIGTVEELAGKDVEAFVQGKKTVFHRVGTPTLEKFHRGRTPAQRRSIVRTLADLEGVDGVNRLHIAEALPYRGQMPGRG